MGQAPCAHKSAGDNSIPGLTSTTDTDGGQKRQPSHIGPNVLPNAGIFYRLLFLARKKNAPVIIDGTGSRRVLHHQFLSDIINLRKALLEQLPPKVQENLWRSAEVTMILICPAGYDFVVGLFAIWALGAIAVPVSPAAPLKEALYFATKSDACAVVTSTTAVALGDQLSSSARPSTSSPFVHVKTQPHLGETIIPIGNIIISKDHILNEEGAGLLIFTSGTTGPPKAVVTKRSALYTGSMGLADWYNIKETDVVMHGLPVHHVTGIGVTILPFILAGACIEFQSGPFRPEKVWDRWLGGGLTVFSGVPTMYMRLMRHFETEISKMPPEQMAKYVTAVRAFQVMTSGSAALPHPLHAKWLKVRRGQRILERYGSTEAGCVFGVEPGDWKNPDGSVGKVYPGLEVKLSEGTEGEILVKNPYMFDRYYGDPAATAASFDERGFFRTGDIARREGEYYFILGRASIDIIKSGGYKISALDIEREILGLDYVGEVIVVGVEDEEYGQRVAAAIVLQDPQSTLSLQGLRQDLHKSLASYKMPTLLRVVPELPKSASGKILKHKLKPLLFPKGGHKDVQEWRKETRLKL